MKYVIILLLSTSGLEQIKYPIKIGLTCNQQAEEWRVNNTTYYDHKNNDAKRQGNYTKEGKLLVGHICK